MKSVDQQVIKDLVSGELCGNRSRYFESKPKMGKSLMVVQKHTRMPQQSLLGAINVKIQIPVRLIAADLSLETKVKPLKLKG